MEFRKRKKLPHEVPAWVEHGATYFITVCCRPKKLNQLCNNEIAIKLKQSIKFRRGTGEWWIRLFLLMPDHCHALISFSPEIEMRKSIANWKRYSARNIGIEWQRDFFDHRIRDDENLNAKAEYVRMNPVRKGLCGNKEDWPYLWSFKDFDKP